MRHSRRSRHPARRRSHPSLFSRRSGRFCLYFLMLNNPGEIIPRDQSYHRQTPFSGTHIYNVQRITCLFPRQNIAADFAIRLFPVINPGNDVPRLQPRLLRRTSRNNGSNENPFTRLHVRLLLHLGRDLRRHHAHEQRLPLLRRQGEIGKKKRQAKQTEKGKLHRFK